MLKDNSLRKIIDEEIFNRLASNVRNKAVEDIVGVQPITGPVGKIYLSGKIFTLKPRYGKTP